ncbi:MAG: hypothetical protein ABI723_14000 [Bacteroidia bacterium]
MKRILPLLLFIFSGCLYDKGDLPEPALPADTTTVSYSKDIVPIMITYCLGVGNQHCHVTNSNQGSVGDFSTYPGLKEKIDSGKFALRVFNSNGGMPPPYTNGPKVIAPGDLQKLHKWVDMGAPDN